MKLGPSCIKGLGVKEDGTVGRGPDEKEVPPALNISLHLARCDLGHVRIGNQSPKCHGTTRHSRQLKEKGLGQ